MFGINLVALEQLFNLFKFLVAQGGGLKQTIADAKARGYKEDVAALLAAADEADAIKVAADQRAKG